RRLPQRLAPRDADPPRRPARRHRREAACVAPPAHPGWGRGPAGAAGGEGGEGALAGPQSAMMWVPQTEGSPAIKANSARAYWPGGRYVDWVGTDFYSRVPAFEKRGRF